MAIICAVLLPRSEWKNYNQFIDHVKCEMFLKAISKLIIKLKCCSLYQHYVKKILIKGALEKLDKRVICMYNIMLLVQVNIIY